MTAMVNVYIYDFFNVSPEIIGHFGVLDISLNSDLPMFIDPFLLFASEKEEYRQLHDQIITYLRFLRDESIGGHIGQGDLQHWFRFKEVKETWLGFSKQGNGGL